jgi:hypothetical protein
MRGRHVDDVPAFFIAVSHTRFLLEQGSYRGYPDVCLLAGSSQLPDLRYTFPCLPDAR